MTPELLRRAEEIYFRVAELPAAARPEAVQQACGGDAALCAEVRALLEHGERVGGFLEEPALGSGFAVRVPGEPDELIGTTVGRYRIEARIASGGMGTIYRAVRDGEFTQRVAIKVVKRGMDSEEILRRFRAERQTLAGLSHPNIARLIDGGALADGRPFLVMEFVEGLPIDEYCERGALPVRERLRLFRTVCEAVRYAHQRLVVHRDLKPGNILVSSDGAPKLLDFGIAKVISGTGSAEVTTVHERRLTPEYASPEQVLGRPVTTASDVYSLGVILYELLSGHRPYRFETRTTAEFERVVALQEPSPPSAAIGRAETLIARASRAGGADTGGRPRDETPERLRRRLRGDLDTIVLMAMRKDPQRRYSSVEQLSADIDRSLADLPVMARKDTAGYRMAKFLQRHRAASVIGAAAVVLLVAGVAAIAWQAAAAAKQRDEAFVARDQAEAISAFLQGMLRSADPARRGPDVTVLEILRETSVRIGADLRDQPRVQAAVRSAIGAAYLSLGLYAEAEDHLRGAYAQRLKEVGPGHHDTAESMADLAALLYAQGSYKEAESLLHGALDIFRKIRGDHNLDIARVMSSLGAVTRAAGRPDEAERYHRESLEIRSRIGGRETLDAAESLNNLAGVYRQQGKPEEAEGAAQEALAIRLKLLGEEHPLTAQSYANLAVMVHSRGDLQRAEPLYRKAVDLETRVLGPGHPDLAGTLSSLAVLLIDRRDYPGAAELMQRAFELRRGALGPADPRTLRLQLALSGALRGARRLDEAEAVVLQAVPIVQEHEVAGELRAEILEEAALVYEARGERGRAEHYRAMLAK